MINIDPSMLDPIQEVILPDNIVIDQERKFMGNLALSWNDITEPTRGYRKRKIAEFAYAATDELPNSRYIIMTRYPNLPYWNRDYSHPYMEELSNYTYTKLGSHHVYRQYVNSIVHMMVEDAATETNGYKMAHSVYGFTY